MSRGILINTLDTYIGTALYEEFLGENPSESPYEIYGTYHQKDDSAKPSFVKKMMKRSKPVLFRKYMREKMDCYIYDLNSGRLDDLKWAVWALTNEPLDGEKTLIVISSVLSWGGNDHKMIEVKPKKKKPVEEGEENAEGGEGEEAANEEEEKEDEEEEKKEEEGEEEKKEEPKEEKKEPKYDEEGNVIEEIDPNKKETDEYGNEILQSQLDENGNEILPSNDDSFEYYFENEYIEMRNKEKKEKEEEERQLKEDSNKQLEEEENKQQDEENEERVLAGSSSHDNLNDDQDKEKSQEDNDEEKEKPKKRVIKVKKIKPKIFKRIGYGEKEYSKRVPISFYRHFKEYEDYLLNLKYENLSIYIICAGIPYGGCETVFNYFFKSAWLQDPIQLPIYGDGANMIPTIHIKDLSKIVKKLAEAKSETPYIFAIDKTKDKTLKNLISSISINIGSGQTVPIEYDKELIKNIVLKHDDFFIDKSKYEKNKLVMNITKHELSWTRFLGIDVMLKPSKFIEEEFEWHCKEGIPKNNKKLLDEFCSLRKLRPLKIILNCKNETMRRFYAEKLSKFYNIPTLNYELMMEKLSMNLGELTAEEVYMNDKFFKLKDKIEFLDSNPDYKNEANELLFDKTEILFECLKYLLNSNAALNRGYVLEGIPVNLEEVEKIYYYKQEIVPEEGEEEEKPEEEEEEDEEEKEEKEEEKNDNNNNKEDDKKEKLNEEEAKDEGDNKEGEGEPKEGDDEEKKDNEEGKDQKEAEEEDNDNKPKQGDDEDRKNEKKEEEDEQEKKEGDEGEINQQEGEEGIKKKKKKKVKKIKPKKYKSKFNKTLLPESVIDLCQVDTTTKIADNTFWEVDAFYQENNIEILNLVYEDEQKEDPEETSEMMRIYVERNGRPFNYFKLKDEDINVNRINYVEKKQKGIEMTIQQQKNNQNKIEEEKEEAYWSKMKERVDFIQKDREQLAQCEKVPTRKFLLINIMPTLTKGLLEVCKINPIDPIDYLADFLFTNSTDNK